MYWINIVASCMITSFGIMLALKNISGENLKKNYFFFFILYCIFSMINYNISEGIQRMVINFIIIVFLSYLLLLKKNLKNSIYYSSIIFIFSIFCEFLISIFLSILINSNLITSSIFERYTLLFTIINSLFIVLISKNNYLNKKIKKYNISNTFIYIIMFILITSLIIIIFKNYYIMDNYLEFLSNLSIYLFLIIIFIGTLKNYLKKESIEIQYNQMLEYVTEYEDIINEQGKKNHEYKNQLMILDGFLEEKKYKQVKEYLNTIIGDQTFGQNYKIKQLSNFPNGGIKGLMYYKINKMEENRIKYFLYVTEDVKKNFENIDLNLYKDITKIFGVIIDNAIDACSETKKKEIVIDLKTEDNFIVINIDNTYENKDIKKVGKKGYSTKGKGHGFGLSLVKDIIRKNNRLSLNSEFNDNYYTHTLFIELKKN